MRELDSSELSQVNGGNPFASGVIAIVGAYEAGKAVGNYVNSFNSSISNMSLGEAIYRASH